MTVVALFREGTRSMWRAFFLSVGIFSCVIGAQCMVVERYVMAAEQPAPATPVSFFSGTTVQKREVVPAEWAPWTLLSAGAVTILYSLTLNRQG